MLDLKLAPITAAAAKAIFEKHSAYRGEFTFAIAVQSPGADEPAVHGVIAMVCDGQEARLGHIWTDGNALIGSLLYGGAWRAAKALGYDKVWI
jgi:hypothetical protein